MVNDIIKLVFGNASAQLVQWLALFGCMYFYTPTMYGRFYLGITIVGIVGIVSSLQMNQAIVISGSRSRSIQILQAGMGSNFIITLLFIILSGMFNHIYSLRLTLFEVMMFAGILFISGLGRLYQGWFVKSGRFEVISKTMLIRAVSLSLMQLSFGWLGMYQGLVVGAFGGELFGVGYMITNMHSPKIKEAFERLSLKRIINILHQNMDFAFGGTVSELVSTIAFSLPVISFGWYYSKSVVGLFSFSHRLIWAPITMVGAVFAQVLYNRLANHGRIGIGSYAYFRKIWLIMGITSLISLMAGILIPNIFILFLERDWVGSYKYMPPLIGWGVFFLASTPYRVMYRVLRLQKLQLVIDILFFGALSGGFVYLAPKMDSTIFCYILGILGVIHQVSLAVMIRWHLHSHDGPTIKVEN